MNVFPSGILIEGCQSPADGEQGQERGNQVQVSDFIRGSFDPHQVDLDEEHGRCLTERMNHPEDAEVPHLVLHRHQVHGDKETEVTPQYADLECVSQQDGQVAGLGPVQSAHLSHMTSINGANFTRDCSRHAVGSRLTADRQRDLMRRVLRSAATAGRAACRLVPLSSSF